jgi:CDP-L-myo-inositol myo-inositolphosphotransferase
MDELEALKRVAWNVQGDIATNLFFRPLSIRITRNLSRTATTPTQITLFLFCLRMIASVLFLFDLYLGSIVAAILLYSAQVLDCVDGELARVKRMPSERGGLLDYFLDRISDFILYLSIAMGLYYASRQYEVIVIGLLAMASNSLMTDLGQKVDRIKQSIKYPYKQTWKSYLTYGGPTSVIILLVTAVLNRILLGLVIIAVCSFLFAIARFLDTYVGLGTTQRKT